MHASDGSTLTTMDDAHAQFGLLLDAVDMAAWRLPTPCVEWNIAHLVGHVASAARIYTDLLEGKAFDEAMHSGAKHTGSDSQRRQEYVDATAQLRRTLVSPGAMARQCDVPGGPIAGVGLATVRIFDVTVHCWDLARALGKPERLPDSIVDHAWHYAVRHYGREQAAAVETAVGVRGDLAPNLHALLLLTGRTP